MLAQIRAAAGEGTLSSQLFSSRIFVYFLQIANLNKSLDLLAELGVNTEGLSSSGEWNQCKVSTCHCTCSSRGAAAV